MPFPGFARRRCLSILLLAGLAGLFAPPAPAQIGVNEFLPRQAPVLKRFSVVAITANNQCLTVQLPTGDVNRPRPEVLLSPCEFGIDNVSQGYFISRSSRERNQVFFAANPAYCLAMDPRNRRLVVIGCGMNAEMFRDYPQFFDLRRGGFTLADSEGKDWCLDTRAREGFSQLFEPFFGACPEGGIAEGFLIRINR